jgi:hypothetical protein
MTNQKFNPKRVFIFVSILVGFIGFVRAGSDAGYGNWSWLAWLLLSAIIAPLITAVGLGVVAMLTEHFLSPIWKWLRTDNKSQVDKE